MITIFLQNSALAVKKQGSFVFSLVYHYFTYGADKSALAVKIKVNFVFRSFIIIFA